MIVEDGSCVKVFLSRLLGKLMGEALDAEGETEVAQGKAFQLKPMSQ